MTTAAAPEGGDGSRYMTGYRTVGRYYPNAHHVYDDIYNGTYQELVGICMYMYVCMYVLL